jgi:hypothetical protein
MLWSSWKRRADMKGKKLTPEEKKARQRECNRKYYEKNREEYLAKQRADYHANLEASRAYMRTWARSYREKHREEIKAWDRAYYAAHREEILAKRREQRQAKIRAQQAGE